MRSLNLLCASVLALTLLPAAAHAVPGFPRDIKGDLSLDYEPPCFICHVKNNTGSGTANTGFALGLRERGLDAEARASLGTALTKLDNDKVDSDGDGVDDVDELREGTDPNSVAPASIRNQPEPEWGCSVAQPGAAGGGWPLGLIGVAIVCSRRRRRARGK